MTIKARADATPTGQAGFSLLELLVAMLILTEVIAGILLLFTGLSDIARVQTDIAEMQQTQRVGQRELVEIVRRAGIGGLPATVRNQAAVTGIFPDGLAIAVDNSVAADILISDDADDPGGIGDGGADGEFPDKVLEGSDILIVRGVFSTPLYYVTPQVTTQIAGDPASMLSNAVAPYRLLDQTLTLQDNNQGLVQDLEPLEDALTTFPKQVLIVRDLLNPGAYGLLETNGLAQTIAACGGNCLSINIRFSDADEAQTLGDLMAGSVLVGAGSGHSVEVGGAGGRTVQFPRHIGMIGLLNEYRYFLRPDSDDPLQTTPTSTALPRLVLGRASMLPGTRTQLGDTLDIADNLLDLQVAVGIDISDDCPPACTAADLLERGRVTEPLDFNDRDEDEVWFNHPGDVAHGFFDSSALEPTVHFPRFHFVRVTTIVHAGRAERGHRVTPFEWIEDENRSDTQTFTLDGVQFRYNDTFNNISLKNYRRRMLTTTIDLRNLQ